MEFEKILDKIFNKLNEYQVQGSFVFDIYNLENIDKVNEIIEEVLKEEGYYDKIKDYRKVFDKNLQEVISEYKPFGTINVKDLKAFNNVAFDNFYNNLAVNVTDTNIKQPIKDALLQYAAGGGKYNDFKSTVKDILATKKIEGNIDIIAREYSTQYKRAQGQILANKFNVKYFRYRGTEIETSRCFCEQRIGNIYTKEEIESWANLNWSGKIKGTNSTNIFQVAGGWNCRHSIRPVSAKTALAYGLNKYNDTDGIECGSGKPVSGGLDNISALVDVTAEDAEKIHKGDVVGYENYVYTDIDGLNEGRYNLKSTAELKKEVGGYISTEKIYGKDNVTMPQDVKFHIDGLGKSKVDALINRNANETIKVSDINIIQRHVFEKPLKKAIDAKNYKVVVFEYKGKYYLNDGNHRVAAAKLNNVDNIKVVVEKVD